MKEKINNFYQSHKYTLWWTVTYITGMYLILKLMFNFSIFSAANWIRLWHAHLYGFAGFVFGLLMLAAVPLYVATTVIIERTKAPLFKIPLPRIPERIKNIFAPKSAPDDAAPTPPPTAPETQPDTSTELPADMPLEMRGPYMRARKYGYEFAVAPKQTPTPTSSDQSEDTTQQQPGEIPIPTDFDFDMNIPDDIDTFEAPVFTEINFDSPRAPDSDDTADTEKEITIPDNDHNAAVMAHLAITGRAGRIENDLVISDNMAIASHTDNDFWIMDESAWFAPGKTRPSPVPALLDARAAGLQAILYLGATNIMDLDTHRAEWESDGITVITDLGEI